MTLDNFLPNNSNDGFDHSFPRLPHPALPQKTNDEVWHKLPGHRYTLKLKLYEMQERIFVKVQVHEKSCCPPSSVLFISGKVRNLLEYK